jgi:hypothetical protein
MGRVAPSGIPEQGALPPGKLLLRIETIEEFHTQGTDKLAYKLTARVIEPEEVAGAPHFENFVVGSDTAPDEIVRTTPGTRAFKTLASKVGVPFDGQDIDELVIPALLEQTVGASLSATKERETNRDGTPNQYAGTVRNRVTAWWTPGRFSPSVDFEKLAALEQDGPAPTARP